MDVPIKFEHHGKTFHGVFSNVSGARGENYDHWHLEIDHIYQGQLVYSDHLKRWRYSSNNRRFDALSDYFEAYMIGWFGSNAITPG